MIDPCANVPDAFHGACEASRGTVVTAVQTPIALPKPVAPVIQAPVFEHTPPVSMLPITGSTQPVVQLPPIDIPRPAPVVQNAPPPPGTYRDAAGNLTSDWHNPYSLYLPDSVQIQPAPIVAASTALTPGAGQTPTSIPSDAVSGNAVSAGPSWFTDPSQELITGIPNWGILAAAVGAYLLLKGRR